MVNKAIVGILVLIVLTSLGVGVLIGTQLGGGGNAAPADSADDGDGSSDDDDGGDTTATPNGTATNATATNGTAANATETQTATPTTTATATPTQTATSTATPTPTATTIPPENFSTSQIESAMVEDINQARAARDLTAFGTGTTTGNQLRQMVRTHSESMAAERRVSFTSDDYAKAKERYEGASLFDRCKYQDPDGGFIVKPDNEFQAVGETLAGQEYTDDGETHFNANESAVAAAIVQNWVDSSTYRKPLFNRGTELIGVGVTITDDGRVYASAAICS